MSPSSLSLPDMKALVGFRSPERISWNVSAIGRHGHVGASSASVAARTPAPSTITAPFAFDHELGGAVKAAAEFLRNGAHGRLDHAGHPSCLSVCRSPVVSRTGPVTAF
jgi:hypothetical protein